MYTFCDEESSLRPNTMEILKYKDAEEEYRRLFLGTSLILYFFNFDFTFNALGTASLHYLGWTLWILDV